MCRPRHSPAWSLLSAAVANAAAILDSLQPRDFARFENDLAKAESHSRVNAAEINALAQDEVALNQMIQSAGLHPHTSLGSLNLQDVVDDALKDTPSEAASNRAPLDEYVAGVPGGHSARPSDDRADAGGRPGGQGLTASARRPYRRTGPSSRPPWGRSPIPISAPAPPIAIRWKFTLTGRSMNS